ncbi:hypothetical protein PanWU01x14_334140 [Parasponia andersonii]|uniref:DUF1985 domain-containing protein n=1 Tax=Parasponia andersonii TaxID=3476 RepID=A0A2P5AGP9_PARAD|nr:hypothetical protein PanWU01x14_334140 [Parasponia andersonii]
MTRCQSKDKLNNLDKYFKDCSSINQIILEKCFKESEFANDKTFISMACLYLISNLLCSTIKDKLVDKNVMHMCESGEFNNHPWGKELFRITLKYLKAALNIKFGKCNVSNKYDESKKLKISKKSVNIYKLYGFLLAFQV